MPQLSGHPQNLEIDYARKDGTVKTLDTLMPRLKSRFLQ
jgi:hypothetical protein